MNVEKVYKMDFTRVYPLLVAKAEKKGRTKAEVDEAICWLTGYGPGELKNLLKSGGCKARIRRNTFVLQG